MDRLRLVRGQLVSFPLDFMCQEDLRPYFSESEYYTSPQVFHQHLSREVTQSAVHIARIACRCFTHFVKQETKRKENITIPLQRYYKYSFLERKQYVSTVLSFNTWLTFGQGKLKFSICWCKNCAYSIWQEIHLVAGSTY